MQWRDFPLPDGSYSDDCRPFTQQDVCNYLPTFAEATGTRSRAKYVPVPGLVTLAGVGNGPHRGIRDVEGKLFVVSGNTLYQVATDGTATSRGTIPGTRRVSMVHNQIDGGNELIIATGDNSYVWNTVTETLTATGVPLLFVDFLNQVIIGIDVARRFFRWSGLADATSWNSLDNESAESSPDRLMGLIVSQGEALLFGERNLEVWRFSPSGNLTFQRSTVIEKGCANGNTICRLDNTVYFVGNDSIAYRLQGYTPVPISSKAITDSISDGDPSKLFAFTWEDKGYVVYYLTAQDGNTWGFDVTCQKWHRRESFGLTRWQVNTLCKWNGDWYAGDYSNGKLYRLTWGNVYEGCEIMPRTLRTGVMHNNGNRMFISALKLLVNTGREPSVASDAPTITGDLPDGDVGDVVDFQYTVTPAYPGQTVTLTLTGALPTGLTMDATGHVTGTLTTGGSYSWTITPGSDCGDGAALADSADVALTEFWLTRTRTGVADATVWSSSTGSTWPVSATRTPSQDAPDLIASLGVGAAAIARYNSSATSNFERTTDLDLSDGTCTTTLTALATTIERIGDFDGVAAAWRTNSATLYFSDDKGLTWTASTIPTTGGGSVVNSLCRLFSGRWIVSSFGVSPQYFYYSDDAIPTTWTVGRRLDNFTSVTGSAGEQIITNGTVALSFGNVNGVARTTDGVAWTEVVLASNDIANNPGIAIGDVFIAPMGGDGTNTRIKRSTDAGLTWATVTVAAGFASAPSSFAYANGVLVAACGNRVYRSTNTGATWALSTLPFTASFDDETNVGAIRRVP